MKPILVSKNVFSSTDTHGRVALSDRFNSLCLFSVSRSICFFCGTRRAHLAKEPKSQEHDPTLANDEGDALRRMPF
jgi:hypothetical protein